MTEFILSTIEYYVVTLTFYYIILRILTLNDLIQKKEYKFTQKREVNMLKILIYSNIFSFILNVFSKSESNTIHVYIDFFVIIHFIATLLLFYLFKKERKKIKTLKDKVFKDFLKSFYLFLGFKN